MEAMEAMEVTVIMVAMAVTVTDTAMANVMLRHLPMLRLPPLLSPATVMEDMATEVMVIMAVMAVTVTDTAMESGKLSLAMATEVTEGAMAAMAMVATGEAMADTDIMASATLRPLPLLSPATVTEDMAMEVMVIMAAMVTDMDTASVMLSPAMATEVMEATVVTEVMAITTEATAVTATAMENKKCQYVLVVSSNNVGQADIQILLTFILNPFLVYFSANFAWKMHTSITLLLRVTHELQNTDNHR